MILVIKDLNAITAVVLGRLFPREKDPVAQATLDQISQVIPRTVAFPASPLPAPSATLAALVKNLIVLDEPN